MGHKQNPFRLVLFLFLVTIRFLWVRIFGARLLLGDAEFLSFSCLVQDAAFSKAIWVSMCLRLTHLGFHGRERERESRQITVPTCNKWTWTMTSF